MALMLCENVQTPDVRARRAAARATRRARDEEEAATDEAAARKVAAADEEVARPREIVRWAADEADAAADEALSIRCFVGRMSSPNRFARGFLASIAFVLNSCLYPILREQRAPSNRQKLLRFSPGP